MTLHETSVHRFALPSAIVGRSVPVTLLLPPGYDEATLSLPLLVYLHGAGGSSENLIGALPDYEEMFESELLPPMVVVSFSTGPTSFYVDPWDRVLFDELLPHLPQRFKVRSDRDAVVMVGTSMGGYGALSLGLRNPTRVRAIAALEPAIEPSFTRGPSNRRGTWWRNPEADKLRWGSPVDEAAWGRNNPASIVRANAAAIRSSGIEIYIDVGDEDHLQLQDGAEFLHRVLWDHDIRHEYRLLRWANHVGVSLGPRNQDAHAFLAAALTGERVEREDVPLSPEEQQLVEWIVEGLTKGKLPPEYAYDPASQRSPAILAQAYKRLRAAADGDPAMARAYAELPPTR